MPLSFFLDSFGLTSASTRGFSKIRGIISGYGLFIITVFKIFVS